MYIDPASGSLVLQLLAAGAISAVVMVGRIRERIKSLFGFLGPRRRRWTGKR